AGAGPGLAPHAVRLPWASVVPWIAYSAANGVIRVRIPAGAHPANSWPLDNQLSPEHCTLTLAAGCGYPLPHHEAEGPEEPRGPSFFWLAPDASGAWLWLPPKGAGSRSGRSGRRTRTRGGRAPESRR